MTTLIATSGVVPALLGLVAPSEGEAGENGFASVLAAALVPPTPEAEHGAPMQAGHAHPETEAEASADMPAVPDGLVALSAAVADARTLPLPGLVGTDGSALTPAPGLTPDAGSGNAPNAADDAGKGGPEQRAPIATSTAPRAPRPQGDARHPPSQAMPAALPDSARLGSPELAGTEAERGDVPRATPIASGQRDAPEAPPAPRGEILPPGRARAAEATAAPAGPPPDLGQARATSDEAPREPRLPPQAAAVAVQAAANRPARPASPSLGGAVSPASFATLNAALSPGQAMPAGQPTATSPGTLPPPAAPTAALAVAGIAQAGEQASSDAASPLARSLATEGEPDQANPSPRMPQDRVPGPSIALGSDDANAGADAPRSAPAVATDAEPRATGAQTQATQGASQSQAAQAQQASAQHAQAPLAGAPGQVMQGLTGTAQTQAAAPAAAPPRPAPTTPAQQLMPVLVTLAGAGGAAAVTVTLDPVELGRVEISVRRGEDQKARVQVVAERPETLLLLLRDQSSLDRALAQAGVGPEGRAISFDLAPRDHQGGQPQAQGGNADGGRGEGRGATKRRDAAAEPDAHTPEPQRRRLSLGALDIAV